MSIKLINLILDNYSKDVSKLEKSVAIAMASRADNKTLKSIFPSYTRLSRECLATRANVIIAVNGLIQKGWLNKISVGSNLTHTNNEYEFNLEKIKESSKQAKFKIKFTKKAKNNPVNN